MAEKITWMYAVRAQAGPSVTGSADLVPPPDGYQKLSLTLEAHVKQDVNVAPGNWTEVQALVVNPKGVAGSLSMAPKGGDAIELDGPLVLLGFGPVALLGNGAATLVMENLSDEDVDVELFVARDATPNP